MEEECADDALLADVVERGKRARQDIRSVERDPEKAWLDGFVAGCFEVYFKAFPTSTPKEEVCSYSASSTFL